ncbi:MAG TPA: PQQ-dependent sugar dehydrogenase [Polyangiaceae bacterium]|nr:PQQ-dependent sugar dehydrogenase [Polyangiaceae bacterium]
MTSRLISGLLLSLALGCGSGAGSPPEPPPPRFVQTVLDPAPGEPVGLAVLPDGRVLHTTRDGNVWLNDGAGGKTLAARIPVYTHDEEGLQGIALDPDFALDAWVYVYYSPPLDTPADDPATEEDEGAAPEQGSEQDWARYRGALRLARFRFDGDMLDLASEQIILEVPVDRGICCHIGGQIDFDAAGNLLLSTGDDTNPFQSGGFTPIDERPERNPAFDAQRSAGNTNDLRGKLLRIHVEADGTYTIPDGNLFPPGTSLARPEIYLMGLRNPYRFAADRRRGVVYLADYAPDAREADPARGPLGTGKWMVVRGPANYGWPYCASAERPYVDFDFASGASGATFDCAAPTNASPRGTGQALLPPVAQPDVFYSYGPSDEFPELGSGGIGPMAGPAYEYDAANPSQRKWPAEFDGAALFYEWTRDLVAAFYLTPENTLDRIEILASEIRVDNPIDLEFGPDGALYVLGYGDAYFMANPDAQLIRIDGTPAPDPVPGK